MRLLRFWLLGGLLSCAQVSSLDVMGAKRSSYDAYLKEHLVEARIFVKLKEKAVVKVLPVDEECSSLQAQLVPGFELKVSPERRLFVVALEMSELLRFNVADYKFLLGETASLSVKEILDGQLLNSLYPFSVPHARAFVVEFPRDTSGDLRVQTSEGQFTFKMEKS